MRILVSDTSVLIDLERGSLLEAAFGLSCEFAVPDLLYRRELRDYNGPHLMTMGLRVEELDSDGIVRAQSYRARKPVLSLPDAFALSLAKTHEFLLLSGDKALRNLAKEEAVECRGVLWLLDRMNDEEAATMEQLFEGLKAIASHPRCRLPTREVNIRLARFGGKDKKRS
jgi:predicted nucleic acid-binding protein